MGKFIDMTGWIMSEHGVPNSRLKVLYRAKNKGKHVQWHCLCSCGTELDIRGDQIKSGVARSCGCLQKEKAKINCSETGKNNKGKISNHRSDLTSQVFGRLTVLKYSHTKNKRAYWECLCSCGNHAIVEGNKLKSGHTKSCGCVKSFGESKICQLLEKEGITFSREYTFSDLKDKGSLRFDFAIFEKNTLICLIEYQGEQHFEERLGKWSPPVEHDALKRYYCKEKNIQLIEIPYTDYEKIDINYLKERINNARSNSEL